MIDFYSVFRLLVGLNPTEVDDVTYSTLDSNWISACNMINPDWIQIYCSHKHYI